MNMDDIRKIVKNNLGKTSEYISNDIIDNIILQIVTNFYEDNKPEECEKERKTFLAEYEEQKNVSVKEDYASTTYTLKNTVFETALKDVFVNGIHGVKINNTGNIIHITVPNNLKIDRKRLNFYASL